MKQPKIRFNGFTGEWEEKNISSVANLKAGKSIDTSQEISFPSNGYYPCFGGNGLRGYVRDYTHDGIYNIIGRQGALCGNVKLVSGKFHATEHAVVVSPITPLDPYFLYNLLTKANINQYATGVAQPGISVQNVNKSLFLVLPDFSEQQIVGMYFKNLDSLIQSTTKKIDSLKQVKAASLQSMFPQEGETTPRIRFKGFEGEWENIKFAAFAEINRGLTYTPNNIAEKGVRVLRSSNIDEDVFIISSEDVFVTPNCINIHYAKEGDILITAANGSPRLVGKHAIIKNTGSIPVVAGGFMYLVTSQESGFLNASMSSSWYWRFLKIGVAGGNGSIGNLNRNDLEEMVFPIPSLKEERDMIASYFTALDSQISLHSQRLEKLKQIKSACLDNMFV